jgi:hypothetical protein
MGNTKFLGLPIDNNLNWKNHIEKMITKLSGACYAIRLIVHISNINTLKSIYYVYFHSAIKYGRLVWCNSSNSEIFTLQKKIVRIMAGAQIRTSCRSLFKQLETCSMPVCTFTNQLNYLLLLLLL